MSHIVTLDQALQSPLLVALLISLTRFLRTGGVSKTLVLSFFNCRHRFRCLIVNHKEQKPGLEL